MKRALAGTVLGFVCLAAQADPCRGTVAVGIVAYDRAEGEALALVFNRCRRPVRVELLVTARNLEGFAVARTLTSAAVTRTEPLSVVAVDLPFVQSHVVLSDYTVEVQKEIALGYAPTEQIVEAPAPDSLVYRGTPAP